MTAQKINTEIYKCDDYEVCIDCPLRAVVWSGDYCMIKSPNFERKNRSKVNNE